MVGMLYWDMKFGRKYAGWDAEAHTEGELEHVFKTFCLVNKTIRLHTAVIWCEVFQCAVVAKALEAANYSHVQPIYWYKYEQNQQLAAHLRVPAVEVGMIAYHGVVSQFSTFINLPMDLYDRHNIVIGPGQRTYIRSPEGDVINPCQKPAYLAQYFGKHYCQPNANVVVLGSGAGGDVQGLMNAGLKVHAIEQDAKQAQAMMAHLRTYKPSDQLAKIVPSGHICSKPEPAEEEEKVVVVVVDVKCDKCDTAAKYPPALKCHSCGDMVCPTCIPASESKVCPVCDGALRLEDVVVPAPAAAHVA